MRLRGESLRGENMSDKLSNATFVGCSVSTAPEPTNCGVILNDT